MQIQLNSAQADTLARLIGEHGDGEPVLLTASHGGSVVVAFMLATFSIDTSGAAEEEG